MKYLKLIPVLAASLIFSGSAFAEGVKTYQVTGPVLEANAKMIVVQKGAERWEIARNETSKIKEDPKVGDKVTIHYRMIATSVETPGSSGKKGK